MILAGHKLLSELHDVRVLHVNVLKVNIVLMPFTSTTNLAGVRGAVKWSSSCSHTVGFSTFHHRK